MGAEVHAYAQRYPATFRVDLSDDASEPVIMDQSTATAEPLVSNSPERNHVLYEAYRGVCREYGPHILLSDPARSNSFVYRSEREYLARYDERFCWRLHFYRGEPVDGSDRLNAVGYGGVLFVRPWTVHCGEAERLEEEPHRISPAICEGYLRPPEELLLSPNYSRCFGNYARPYSVLPFECLPLVAGRYGAVCAQNTLSAAMIIAELDLVLSPYEVSVTALALGHPLAAGSPERGLSIEECGEVIRKGGGGHWHRDSCPTQDASEAALGPASLADTVCRYLFMGIPVLYPVDYATLYEAYPADGAPDTKEHGEQHMVLIHSMTRPHAPGVGQPSRFVYADYSALHHTGGLFRQCSAEHLYRSRLKADADPGRPALLGACARRDRLPIEVERVLRLSAIAQLIGDGSHGGAAALPGAAPVPNELGPGDLVVAVRDVAQLPGYLLQRVLPHVYADPVRHSEATLREFARQCEGRARGRARPVWIAEVRLPRGGVEGVALWQSLEGDSYGPIARFSTQAGAIVLLDESGKPCSCAYTGASFATAAPVRPSLPAVAGSVPTSLPPPPAAERDRAGERTGDTGEPDPDPGGAR